MSKKLDTKMLRLYGMIIFVIGFIILSYDFNIIHERQNYGRLTYAVVIPLFIIGTIIIVISIWKAKEEKVKT